MNDKASLTSNERLMLREDGRPYPPDMELSWQTFLGNRGAMSPDFFEVARIAYIAAWHASLNYAKRRADETTRQHDPKFEGLLTSFGAAVVSWKLGDGSRGTAAACRDAVCAHYYGCSPVEPTPDQTGGDPECFGSAGAPRSEEEFRARVGLPPKARERHCVCGLAVIPEGELRVEVGPTTHRLAGPCFQTSSVNGSGEPA